MNFKFIVPASLVVFLLVVSGHSRLLIALNLIAVAVIGLMLFPIKKAGKNDKNKND